MLLQSLLLLSVPLPLPFLTHFPPYAAGTAPEYIMRTLEKDSASEDADGVRGGGFACSVRLPCTDMEGAPMVLESGDCMTEEAARSLASFAACRFLFDMVTCWLG